MSVLLMVNGYFIFSCMLYGRSQGLVWQRGWLIGSVVNLLLDIFVKQVNIVVVVYYFIPNMILQRALTVKQIIRRAISTICQSAGNSSSLASHQLEHSAGAFSATDYLFVSTRVAKQFPNLLESAIVLSYRSPTVSHSQSKQWSTSTASTADMEHGGLLSMLTAWINSLLLLFGGMSTTMQVLLISVVNPALIGAVAFLGAAVFNSAYLAVPLGLILILVSVGLYLVFGRKVLIAPIMEPNAVRPVSSISSDEEHVLSKDSLPLTIIVEAGVTAGGAASKSASNGGISNSQASQSSQMLSEISVGSLLEHSSHGDSSSGRASGSSSGFSEPSNQRSSSGVSELASYQDSISSASDSEDGSCFDESFSLSELSGSSSSGGGRIEVGTVSSGSRAKSSKSSIEGISEDSSFSLVEDPSNDEADGISESLEDMLVEDIC
jgi:hypothetical protein